MSFHEPINDDDDQQQQYKNLQQEASPSAFNEETSSPPQRSETGMATSTLTCDQTSMDLVNTTACGDVTPHDQMQQQPSSNGQQSKGAAAQQIARPDKKNYNASEQTHSTVAELSEAFRMFTNVHGAVHQSVLASKDLMKAMQQTGLRPTEKDVTAIIQVIDQNQGGNISFDEFASLLGRSVPMEEVDSLQAAFVTVDKNRTGIVSSAAFAELMANYGECSSPEEVSEMLAFADPNNTGHVNYRVFLRMLGLRLR